MSRIKQVKEIKQIKIFNIISEIDKVNNFLIAFPEAKILYVDSKIIILKYNCNLKDKNV